MAQASGSAALWAAHDAYKPKRCGLIRSCPRQYSLADVNASALEAGTPAAEPHIAAQRASAVWATSFCTGQGRAAGHAAPIKFNTKIKDKSSGGAWCLPTSQDGTRLQGKLVELPRGQSYTMPKGHNEGDTALVRAVYRWMLSPRAATPGGGRSASPRSVIDLGAGVGQFGRTLHSLHPQVPYRSFDGSGNIDVLTNGFVKYADLSQPLEVRPRADWVISLEVAEHLPNQREGFYVRNLHAHNCLGLLLSWGMLSQGGLSHINNHSPEYVIETFEQLGYSYDGPLAQQLLNASEGHYSRLHVFRRLTPPPGCTSS